jgi:signal peptidase S26 family
VVGTIIVNDGAAVRPSQLIASVRRTWMRECDVVVRVVEEVSMRVLVILVILVGAVSAPALAQEYRRGDEVRVQTADGQPAAPPVQRVMAVPGDHIKIDGKSLAVNDRAITDISPKLLLACGTWDEVVPARHYFLVGEQIEGGSASRSCSLLPVGRILETVQH